VQALANKRSSRVILYLRVFSGKCDKSALVTSHRGGRKARSGAVARDRCRNTKTAKAHPLDSLIPRISPFPSYRHPPRAHRGRVYIQALLPAVESTAPSSEQQPKRRERERERERGERETERKTILAAAVSESAIPVSPLYRRPPHGRNSDRA